MAQTSDVKLVSAACFPSGCHLSLSRAGSTHPPGRGEPGWLLDSTGSHRPHRYAPPHRRSSRTTGGRRHVDNGRREKWAKERERRGRRGRKERKAEAGNTGKQPEERCLQIMDGAVSTAGCLLGFPGVFFFFARPGVAIIENCSFPKTHFVSHGRLLALMLAWAAVKGAWLVPRSPN